MGVPGMVGWQLVSDMHLQDRAATRAGELSEEEMTETGRFR